MKDSRYQFQPWWVRLYRWLRYMPLAFVVTTAKIVKFLASGWKPDESSVLRTRWEVVKHIYRSGRSIAHFNMGNWITSEELIESLQDTGKGN